MIIGIKGLARLNSDPLNTCLGQHFSELIPRKLYTLVKGGWLAWLRQGSLQVIHHFEELA